MICLPCLQMRKRYHKAGLKVVVVDLEDLGWGNVWPNGPSSSNPSHLGLLLSYVCFGSCFGRQKPSFFGLYFCLFLWVAVLVSVLEGLGLGFRALGLTSPNPSRPSYFCGCFSLIGGGLCFRKYAFHPENPASSCIRHRPTKNREQKQKNTTS